MRSNDNALVRRQERPRGAHALVSEHEHVPIRFSDDVGHHASYGNACRGSMELQEIPHLPHRPHSARTPRAPGAANVPPAGCADAAGEAPVASRIAASFLSRRRRLRRPRPCASSEQSDLQAAKALRRARDEPAISKDLDGGTSSWRRRERTSPFGEDQLHELPCAEVHGRQRSRSFHGLFRERSAAPWLAPASRPIHFCIPHSHRTGSRTQQVGQRLQNCDEWR